MADEVRVDYSYEWIGWVNEDGELVLVPVSEDAKRLELDADED